MEVDQREIFGWKMYDWANSAFYTTVTTALLGPYLVALADDQGGVEVLGLTLEGASLWSFAVALSAFIQVLVLPLVGVLADHTDTKKQLMMNLTFFSAAFTVGLFLVTDSTILLGAGFYVVASAALSAAVVVYNSYLPEIAPPELRDRVSSGGYAYGYFGGGLWLAINFVLITVMSDAALAARLSLAGTGIWMAVFAALYTQPRLRPRPATEHKPADTGWLPFTYRSIRSTLRDLGQNHPMAMRYLIAYLLFNDGVQTVIAIAGVYATTELDAETSTLLALVLMIQFVAGPGAWGFGRLAERIGAKPALMINLSIWIVLVVYAFADLDSITKLWILGVFLAFVLGGSQALARSLFAQMIPAESEARYFGFFEISSRGTSWLGPLVFGLANELTGSARIAILALVVFFVLGLLLLIPVDVRRGMREAGQDPERLARV
jgi:UMF1 family MFS transporter